MSRWNPTWNFPATIICYMIEIFGVCACGVRIVKPHKFTVSEIVWVSESTMCVQRNYFRYAVYRRPFRTPKFSCNFDRMMSLSVIGSEERQCQNGAIRQDSSLSRTNCPVWNKLCQMNKKPLSCRGGIELFWCIFKGRVSTLIYLRHS